MILITGGFGFIGQNLARRLLREGQQVTLARFRTSVLPGDLEARRGGDLQVLDLDLHQPWATLKTLESSGLTEMVHLATAGWSGSIAADFDINVGGLLNLLEGAQRLGVRRVVAASSIAVYGAAPGPYFESEALSVELPGNGPGCFKRAEEVAGGFFGASTGLDVAFARISLVYGPGYRSMWNLVSRVAAVLARGGELDTSGALPPYADYCHVDDIAAGLAAMVTADQLPHRTYNLGYGAGLSKADLVVEAAKQGLAVDQVARLEALPSWPLDKVMSIDRAAADFGYAPKYRFARGLAHYVAALR